MHTVKCNAPWKLYEGEKLAIKYLFEIEFLGILMFDF